MVVDVEPFQRITVFEAKAMVDGGRAQVFDVRPPADFFGAHIPGSISMPLMAIRSRQGEVEPDKDLLFICEDGTRSSAACRLAASLGLTNLYDVAGGINAWIDAGYIVEAI